MDIRGWMGDLRNNRTRPFFPVCIYKDKFGRIFAVNTAPTAIQKIAMETIFSYGQNRFGRNKRAVF
jgi:hypothetical protein